MLQSLINFLFPKSCVYTHQEGEYLSKEGRRKLVAHPPMCPASHHFSQYFSTLPAYRKDFVLDGVHICFQYTSYLKKLILRLKYYHQKDVVETLIERVFLSIQTNSYLWHRINTTKTCITSVPSHRRRKYITKGYNQSEILAQHLALKLNLPYQAIFSKKHHTRSQTSLTRQERMHNVSGSFALVENNALATYETVLIVDDIVTTGSTLRTLAGLVKMPFPNCHVWGLVIGRHHG